MGSPNPVLSGHNFAYTINFTNAGPNDAQMVTVSDPLPTHTTFVSATVPAGWSRTDATPVGGTGTIVFARATDPSGDTAAFTIVVKVDPNTANGTTITNTATAATATTDL